MVAVRTSEIILSHYFWPIMMFIASYYIIKKPIKNKVPELISPKQAIFIKNNPPAIISHITDIHLSPAFPRHYTYGLELFDFINNKMKSDAIIVTGDVVDGTESSLKITHHGQFESNWEIYEKFIFNLTSLPMMILAGNHDETGISSLSDEKHYFAKLMNSSSFHVQTLKVNSSSGIIKIVGFNPFRFPTPPMPFGLYVRPTHKTLSKLENEIKKNDSNITILASHFPHNCFYTRRNRSSVSYTELINQAKPGIPAYLVGHFHQKKPFATHIGGTVEYIGGAVAKDALMGVLTVDGGIVSYSMIDHKAKFPFVITSPSPKLGFSPHSAYIPEAFRIRVAVFSKNTPNISAFIDGKMIGFLSKDCDKSDASIYGINASARIGTHILELRGDVNEKRQFLVGNVYAASKEKGISFFMRFNTLSTAFIILLLFASGFFILPPILKRICEKSLEDFGLWLAEQRTPKFSYWLRCIVMGPFFVYWSYSRSPQYIRFAIKVVLFATAAVPMYFFKYDNDAVIVFLWGVVTRTGIQTCVVSFIIGICVLAIYFIPFLYMAGIASGLYPRSRCITMEFALLDFLPFSGVICLLVVIYAGEGFPRAFRSPLLILASAIYVVLSAAMWHEMALTDAEERNEEDEASGKIEINVDDEDVSV